MDSYTIKFKNTEGKSDIWPGLTAKGAITFSSSLLLDNDDISQIIIQKRSPEHMWKDVRAWFIECICNEDILTLSDAIFTKEDKKVWPYELILDEDIPEDIFDDLSSIAVWLWDSKFSSEQRKHIANLTERSDIFL